MSQTLNGAGRPLFFPSSLATDEDGVILPRPLDELKPFVGEVASNQLLPFIRRLINGTAKRRRQERWSAVNRQRLLLARLCIDRMLEEGSYTLAPDAIWAGNSFGA